MRRRLRTATAARTPLGSRPRSAVGAGLVALLVVVALVAVPLVKLVQVMTEDGGRSVSRVLRAPGLGSAALHTVILACVVPLLAVPLGGAMAIFLRRADVAMRRLLQVLTVLPLIVPQFVLGYSWTQAYGRSGFTDAIFGLHWAGLEGPIGIMVVLVVDAVPLSYLLTAAGLATRAQPDLEAAARLSGASAWTALRTVTLPLLRPVFAAELVLTFVATLESFAAPQVLGVQSGFSTLTTRIYSDLSLASDPNAFVDAVTLAIGLVVIAAVILLPADLVLGPRLRTVRSGQQASIVTRAQRSWRTVSGAVALLAYSALTVGLPMVALISAAVTKAIGLPSTPSNWTLDNFRAALDSPTLRAIANSVELAASAAFALAALGALIAALERRRAGRALGTLAIVTFAIPGSTLAVGLLIAYGRWLGGTVVLVLLAYLAKFWALAHRSVAGAVDRLPPDEWQAARVSGAAASVAVRTVWLPALAPALLGAWILVFLSALHEVTMSSLLYSFGNQTLAVAVLNSQELGEVGVTAALSVLLTGLVLAAAAPVWLLLQIAVRRRRSSSTARLSLRDGRLAVAGAR